MIADFWSQAPGTLFWTMIMVLAAAAMLPWSLPPNWRAWIALTLSLIGTGMWRIYELKLQEIKVVGAVIRVDLILIFALLLWAWASTLTLSVIWWFRTPPDMERNT